MPPPLPPRMLEGLPESCGAVCALRSYETTVLMSLDDTLAVRRSTARARLTCVDSCIRLSRTSPEHRAQLTLRSLTRPPEVSVSHSDSPLRRSIGLSGLIWWVIVVAATIAVGAAFSAGRYAMGSAAVVFLVAAVVLGFRAQRHR